MPDTEPTPAAATPVAGILNAVFSPDLAARCERFDFLELSYVGGVSYKDGYDSKGKPILIEHEQESPIAFPASEQVNDLIQNQAKTTESIKLGRYHRRKRIAAYENHVKPIVDKVAAYLLRDQPKRAEPLEADLQRIKIDENIRAMVEGGLKLSEAWIGWDAANLPVESGQAITQAQAAAMDPDNKGKPYIVMADPRRIVDSDVDEDDSTDVRRVVIEEVEITKESLTSPVVKTVRYKEWTKDSWTLYVAVDESGKTINAANELRLTVHQQQVKVKIEEGPTPHAFGRCPWVLFKPSFPIEDVAELNRALFNMSSLLDEEMYANTFTQKVVTGVRPSDMQKATAGTGNVWVFENQDAEATTLASQAGQAEALMNRIDHLRASIYSIVSMESSSTKNVAEAAEKKKRDMEALYTSLVRIIGQVEDAENAVLKGMGLIGVEEPGSKDDKRTTYSRKFDVNSVADLLAELEMLQKVPFVPPSFKRQVVMELLQKMDPQGAHDDYQKDIEEGVDGTPGVADAIATLVTSKAITASMAAWLLGVPESQLQEFTEAFDAHPETPEDAFLEAGGDPNALALHDPLAEDGDQPGLKPGAKPGDGPPGRVPGRPPVGKPGARPPGGARPPARPGQRPR